jgi:hypothetical protein
VNAATTNRWIYDPNGTITGPDGGSAKSVNTKYLSFGTPIGGIPDAGAGGGDGGDEAGASETKGPQYCGKAVFSDLHASSSPSGDIPGKCNTNDLSAQEKALEYLFFDLSACVHDDSKPPPPPPPPVPVK